MISLSCSALILPALPYYSPLLPKLDQLKDKPP